MVLYSDKSLFQVHYTDHEEFAFQVQPRNSLTSIPLYLILPLPDRLPIDRATADTVPAAARESFLSRCSPQNVGGLDSRTYWSSFLVTFPVDFRYKAGLHNRMSFCRGMSG